MSQRKCEGGSTIEQEILKIFDEKYILLGVASREDVHKYGHWHETFHCWFIGEEHGKFYLYFQLRSNRKKDFPDLLDITSAGHILAHETIQDGVREVREELGIEVSIDELVPMGVIRDEIVTKELIDRELCNVFIYHTRIRWREFKLQDDEVSGIFRTPFNSFYEMCLGKAEHIVIEGFKTGNSGDSRYIVETVRREQFVPHEENYLKTVAKLIMNYLQLLD